MTRLLGTMTEAILPPELSNAYTQLDLTEDSAHRKKIFGIDRITGGSTPLKRDDVIAALGRDPFVALIDGGTQSDKGELAGLQARVDELSMSVTGLAQALAAEREAKALLQEEKSTLNDLVERLNDDLARSASAQAQPRFELIQDGRFQRRVLIDGNNNIIAMSERSLALPFGRRSSDQTTNSSGGQAVRGIQGEDLNIESRRSDIRSDSRLRRGWNRTSGWIGRRLPGGQRTEYDEVIVQEVDGVPTAYATEVYEDDYRTSERRRGASILGVVALTGAAIVAAGLWGEHEENEGRQSQAKQTQTVIHNNQELNDELNSDKNKISQLTERAEADEAKLAEAKAKLLADAAEIKALKAEEANESETGQNSDGDDGESSDQGGSHSKKVVRVGGRNFYVEPGNGIVAELQQYSRAHGYGKVGAYKAWQIYLQARQRFGQELVETSRGTNNTYIRREGDVGISESGAAMWPKDVKNFFDQRLSER
jgi:hypothetical protein